MTCNASALGLPPCNRESLRDGPQVGAPLCGNCRTVYTFIATARTLIADLFLGLPYEERLHAQCQECGKNNLVVIDLKPDGQFRYCCTCGVVAYSTGNPSHVFIV